MINLIDLDPSRKLNYYLNNGLSNPRELENNKLIKNGEPYNPPIIKKDEVQSPEAFKNNFVFMDNKAAQLINKKNTLVQEAELFAIMVEKAQEAYNAKDYKAQKLLEANIALKSKLNQLDNTNFSGYAEEESVEKPKENSNQIVSNTETITEITTEIYEINKKGKVEHSVDQDTQVLPGIAPIAAGTTVDIDKDKNGTTIVVTSVETTVSTDVAIVQTATTTPVVPPPPPEPPTTTNENKSNFLESAMNLLAAESLDNFQFNGILNMLSDYRMSLSELDYNNNLQETLDFELIDARNAKADYESQKDYTEKNKIEISGDIEYAEKEDRIAVNQNMIRAYLDQIQLAQLK